MGGSWNPIRDIIESIASVGGNYLLPGSSLLTGHLVSKGAQNDLSSPLGIAANIGSGLTGGGAFGSGLQSAGGALESSALSGIGSGLTSAGNSLGGAFGDATLGTDAANGLSNIGNSVSQKFSSLFGGGNAPIGGAGADLATSPTGTTAAGTGGGSSAYSGSSSGFDPSKGLNTSALNASYNPATSAIATGASTPSIAGQIAAGVPTATGGGLFSSLLNGAGNSGASGGLGTANILGTVGGGINSYLANQQAQKDLLSSQGAALGQLQPYLQTGAAANSRLSDLLGTSGNTTAQGYGSLAKPFDPSNITSDPGYQFQLQQGDQALARKQAATGNYFSGGALKAAQDYGQGLANTSVNDAYNRYLSGNQQQYNELAGQTGTGLGAANSAAGINTNIGNAQANAGISSSNILNSTLSSLLSGSGAKRTINIGGQTVTF